MAGDLSRPFFRTRKRQRKVLVSRLLGCLHRGIGETMATTIYTHYGKSIIEETILSIGLYIYMYIFIPIMVT